MAKTTKIKTGSKVTYHYWHDGELRGYPAKVVAVFDPDDEAQALVLDVDFHEDVIASGITARQSHARQRTRAEDDVHASGTWTP